MTRAAVAVLAGVVAGVIACGACASASDIERRGKRVLDATDPDKLGYCPAEPLARARVAVAVARAASERGEPLDAARAMDEAEREAAAAQELAAACDTAPSRGEPTKAPDRDGDGIDDARDRCLDQPEDRDGWVDDDGCPDPDDDGDGLSDVIDKCPREPEDQDGFEDLDGCPEAGP